MVKPKKKSKTQKTKEAFGYQWGERWTNLESVYDDPKKDLMSSYDFYNIPDSFFRGKTVLDAGCGFGRGSLYALIKGARKVIGFDLHDGIKHARKLCDPLRSEFFQASMLEELPIKRLSIDSVMAIGTMHHTGDTRKAFINMAEYVKPGGRMFVFIHRTSDNWKEVIRYYFDNPIRFATSRMPDDMLIKFCEFIYWLNDAPLVKYPLRLMFTTPHSSGFSPRKKAINELFDWYNTPITTMHPTEEIIELYRECGFDNIRQLNPHSNIFIGDKVET